MRWLLSDAGFDIALVDLLEAEMAGTACDIEARRVRTLTVQGDVSDFARAHEIVEEIIDKSGTLTCREDQGRRGASPREVQ